MRLTGLIIGFRILCIKKAGGFEGWASARSDSPRTFGFFLGSAPTGPSNSICRFRPRASRCVSDGGDGFCVFYLGSQMDGNEAQPGLLPACCQLQASRSTVKQDCFLDRFYSRGLEANRRRMLVTHGRVLGLVLPPLRVLSSLSLSLSPYALHRSRLFEDTDYEPE